ncbi:MAG: hypothetical protein ABI680_03890 [Chthoniobacteraceae bacterium]
MKTTDRSTEAPQNASKRPWWKVRRTLLSFLTILSASAAALWFVPEIRVALLYDVVRPLGEIARAIAALEIWPAVGLSTGIGLLAAKAVTRARKNEQSERYQLSA